MLDCLTEIKERFQGFVDGQNTFGELKHAVSREVLNRNDTVVRDFVSTAHRDGFLSNTHFRTLIDEITSITGQAKIHNLKHAENPGVLDNLPKAITVLNNRFVLGSIIGKGGMGVVYKARDLRKMEVNDSDDIVAIKVLSSNLRAHPESLIALQREAKKAQKLAHPNIVTVYDFDRDGDIAYMTMEYLDGITLNKIIQAKAPITRREGLRIISSIAHGLTYAHKHKIVHSDLKPSNIFLLKDGTIKILDFGIARAFMTNDEKSGITTTTDSQIFTAFTPAYASCEMIENMPPTPKDDIYALGCVAHELLTRQHPYTRKAANKAKEENEIVKRNKNLTVHEYRAIVHAVELNKHRRTESINEFIQELVKPETTLSSPVGWALKLGIITLVLMGAIYIINKIETYEDITAKQTIIVNMLEIENTLKQADKYLMNDKLIKQDKNDALALYQHALKLSPDNLHAKSGIEKVKRSYIKHIQTAIKSNELTRASELLGILEVSFEGHVALQQLKDDLNWHVKEKLIKSLLSKANKEEVINSYVRPENANAHDTYLQILKLAPGEVSALEGLDRIQRFILAETEALIEKSEWVKAESRIKDALLILPGNADAVALFNEIKTLHLSDKYQQIQNKIASQLSNRRDHNRNTEELVDELKLQLITERLSVSQKLLIETYTLKADYYVSQNLLLGPNNENASFYYKKILTIDSSNEHAKKGLDYAWHTLINSVNREVNNNNFNETIDNVEKYKNLFSYFYDVESIIIELSTERDNHLTNTKLHQDIALLLAQAESHVEANRLTAPKDNNAMKLYLNVLQRDPNNEEAKSGLKKVENIFASHVRSNINSKQLIKAGKILHRGLRIYPASKILSNLKVLLRESKEELEKNNLELESSRHVANLINEAKIAFSRKRYILPVGSSAYDLYSKITSSEPGNTVAIRGLNEAKFRVYDQIESDIRNKNYQTAYINIDRLSKLNLHDKRFTSLRARLLSLGNNYEKITTDLNNHDDYLLYLLMVANQQEIKGNIWPPVSNNAYNIYKRVLDLESSNSTAREALNALFEKRLSFINNLLDKKHWNEAEREIQAFDKLYSSKNEKAIISSTLEELIRLKDSDAQSSTF